jgi:Ca2+-binding RTX toxin-like protein
MKLKLIPALAALAMLAAAPAAQAATRYASPGGTGPSATCPRENPCNIHIASGTPATAGDTVVALPGTYSLGTVTLTPAGGVTLIGEPGAPRPRLVSSGASALTLGAGTTVRNLYIEGNNAGSGRAVDAIGAGTLIEQSEIVGSGTTGITLQLRDGATVASSIVRSNASVPFGSAVLTGGSGGTIHNVTAIGAGTAPSTAISSPSTFGSIQRVSIVNSIADGNGGAAIATSDDGGTDDIQVRVEFSNFPELSVAPPEATITFGAGNQTGATWPAPQLASPITADFHQLGASPTVDAGAAGFGGPLDVDGQRRSMEDQVDIGADEFPGHCAGRTATVTGTTAADKLTGTSGPDVFVGLGGNDAIKGLGGDDVACGGDGKDTLLGAAGNDRLLGENGKDKLRGGAGKDRLLGGKGKDDLVGGKGKDKLNGGPGRDSQRP